MYRNNFVAVIKNKGKIMREDDNGIVRLPFGSEYSILLKNKDSRRAVVNVEIDDNPVAYGIIVMPNSDVELKGELEGLAVKNKFKFIQKTKQIQKYRGDRLGDGLVRIEYWFEQRKQEQPPITIWPNPKPWYKDDGKIWDDQNTGGWQSDWSYTVNHSSNFSNCAAPVEGGGTQSAAFFNHSNPMPDEGITVRGSETKQNFTYGFVDTLESFSSVIILHLRGANSRLKKIRKPITVKTKLTCPTCGTKSKSAAKFCRNCGTYLR